MTRMTKGSNGPLPHPRLYTLVRWTPGPVDVDISALLLTGGKVRGDADFVFYNQPVHPRSGVRHVGKKPGADTLELDLSSVEAQVDMIVVAASADGGTFGQVRDLTLEVYEATSNALITTFHMSATSETAFVVAEVYRRAGDWKLRAVGQGYDSGLAGLATDFGISVDDRPTTPPPTPTQNAPSPPPTYTAPPAPPPSAYPPPPPAGYPPQPQPGYPAPAAAAWQSTAPPPLLPSAAPVSLKKQQLAAMEVNLQKTAPALLSLTKTAAVSLRKRGLDEHTARVALVLDISASMMDLYKRRKIQDLAERVLALGMRFDDNQEIDVFVFGEHAYQASPMTLENHRHYTDEMLRRYPYEGATYYDAAMGLVRQHYFGHDGARSTTYRDEMPVYCMFITDGDTHDEDACAWQLRWSSYEPIFWQFMAIGESSRAVDSRMRRTTRSDFPFLEELDDLPGRQLDNANFFAVTDPKNIPDSQLFELMMTEYPGWLPQARRAGQLA